MAEEAVAEVVTEGAPAEEVTDAEPFGAPEGEPTGGETGETAQGAESEPDLYTVRVGGREERVNLEEALNGYMRQQDYTRKTQEVAQQREQLAQMAALQAALERDPRTTLATLAGALGVDLATGQTAQAPAGEQDPYELLVGKVDSLTATLTAQQQAALDAQRQAQEMASIKAQVDREIADLKASHGDFDESALARFAVENGVTNLAVAFNAWQFEQEQQRRISETNRAIEAKRKQAAVVSGGHTSSPTGTVVPGGGGQRMSVREAFLAAAAAAK